MNQAVLTCKSLSKSYTQGKETLHILNNLNLNIYAGERIAIVGDSGSGKSSLLSLMGALDTPTSGHVEINGQKLAKLDDPSLSNLRNQQLGFVYQFHHLLPEFNALENAAMPLLIAGQSKRTAFPEAEALLSKVGLSHRLTHKPSELSGGERQRVAIARALVNTPACVLMDEPTGNLDSAATQSIQNLISDLANHSQTAFVIVTHDLQVAKTMDKIYKLENGGLSEQHND